MARKYQFRYFRKYWLRICQNCLTFSTKLKEFDDKPMQIFFNTFSWCCLYIELSETNRIGVYGAKVINVENLQTHQSS